MTAYLCRSTCSSGNALRRSLSRTGLSAEAAWLCDDRITTPGAARSGCWGPLLVDGKLAHVLGEASERFGVGQESSNRRFPKRPAQPMVTLTEVLVQRNRTNCRRNRLHTACKRIRRKSVFHRSLWYSTALELVRLASFPYLPLSARSTTCRPHQVSLGCYQP